jgi:hypothetical protein
MSILRPFQGQRGREGFRFWCPGCKTSHSVNVNPAAGRPCWGFNGNVDRPTFTPSVLVTMSDPDGELPDERCHSFVRDGRIQFLGDCTHALSGQTVDLPPFPDPKDWA